MKKQSENQIHSQEEQSEQPKEQYEKLKTKPLPAIMMLTGGAVAAIVTFVRGFTLKEMLVIVLVCLLIFYILGLIMKKVFDSFHIRIKQENVISEEGEVIEKEPEGEKADESADKKK